MHLSKSLSRILFSKKLVNADLTLSGFRTSNLIHSTLLMSHKDYVQVVTLASPDKLSQHAHEEATPCALRKFVKSKMVKVK